MTLPLLLYVRFLCRGDSGIARGLSLRFFCRGGSLTRPGSIGMRCTFGRAGCPQPAAIYAAFRFGGLRASRPTCHCEAHRAVAVSRYDLWFTAASNVGRGYIPAGQPQLLSTQLAAGSSDCRCHCEPVLRLVWQSALSLKIFDTGKCKRMRIAASPPLERLLAMTMVVGGFRNDLNTQTLLVPGGVMTPPYNAVCFRLPLSLRTSPQTGVAIRSIIKILDNGKCKRMRIAASPPLRRLLAMTVIVGGFCQNLTAQTSLVPSGVMIPPYNLVCIN